VPSDTPGVEADLGLAVLIPATRSWRPSPAQIIVDYLSRALYLTLILQQPLAAAEESQLLLSVLLLISTSLKKES